MRIFLVILFLILVNCSSSNKYTYMCGERECVDKKEIDEYFEKNLSVEVLILNKENNESLDLVKLNLLSRDQKKQIKDKSVNKKKILKFKKSEEKKILKKRLKEERKLAKLKIKEEKKSIKLNKKKKNQSVKKKIKQIKFKKEKNVNRIKNNKICYIVEKCDIDEISKHLIEIGKKKDYPDITKN